MAINRPPIEDSGDGTPIPSLWATWVNALWGAIAGWRQTLTGSVVIDCGSIAANTQSSSATLTIQGAATTDLAIVQPSTQTSGLIFTAFVSAVNTVTIRACNFTAGSIDPPSTTFRVILFKQ